MHMKTVMRDLGRAVCDVLAFIGGVSVGLCLCMLPSFYSDIIASEDPDTTVIRNFMGLLAAGIVFLFLGTKFVYRSRSFLSNAWIGSTGFTIASAFVCILVYLDWRLGGESVVYVIYLFMIVSFGLLLSGVSIRALLKSNRYSVKLQSVESSTGHRAEPRDLTTHGDAGNQSLWAMSRKRKSQVRALFALASAILLWLFSYPIGLDVALEGPVGAILTAGKAGFYGGLVGYLLISLMLYFVPDK
jgi:hypothetical protein